MTCITKICHTKKSRVISCTKNRLMEVLGQVHQGTKVARKSSPSQFFLCHPQFWHFLPMCCNSMHCVLTQHKIEGRKNLGKRARIMLSLFIKSKKCYLKCPWEHLPLCLIGCLLLLLAAKEDGKVSICNKSVSQRVKLCQFEWKD